MTRESTETEIDGGLRALRQELAGVTPSPGFQSRVRQRIAGEPDLLREELAAVAASPEFRARVRQEIEASGEARGASWDFGWRWLVPVAAVAAVVLLAVVLSERTAETPAPVAVTAQREVPTAVVPMPITSVTPAPAAPTHAPIRSSKFEVRSSTAEPSLEVITDQPAILRAIVARAVAGALQVDVSATPLLGSVPEIIVPPIEVNPIVVKSLVETPEGRRQSSEK